MKRNKKALAALMALTLAGSLVTGCSSSGTSATPAPTAKEAAGSTTAAPAGEAKPADDRQLLADGNTYATGLPIVKKKVTFKIARPKNALDSTQDTNEKPILKQMEKDTNIHIEWVDIPPGEGSKEQVSILLSTDMPDAFMAGLVESTDIMKDYDSFVPLNDLMDKYAPHLKATYDKTNGEAMKILTYPNGKMYSFMSSVYTQHKSWTIGCHFINKKWLDKLGLQVPTTLDEYYKVLKAFKTQDPNGNGKADEIPLGYCENEYQARLIQFMGPFGFNDNFRIENGKVLPTTNTPAYRQFLDYYHKLASEGLLDVEGFSQTAQQFMSKAKQGLYGSFYAWTPDTIIDNPDLASQYVQMLPLTAPGLEGKATVYGMKNRFMGAVNGFVITSACKDPAALVRWYDYMGSSVKMKQTARIGEEGKMWEMRDGKVYELQDQGPNFNFQNACYTYGLMQACPVLLYPDEMAYDDPKTSPQNYKRDQYVTAVEKWISPEGLLPSRIASAEASLDKATYEPDLLNYIKSFTADAIVNGVTDASWQKHLSDLEKYRYSEWIQWQQNYLDGKF